MTHVIAMSGGKDSTAMAIRLAEVEPRDYIYIVTPTGDELPAMLRWWDDLEILIGKPLTRITNKTLDYWIEHFNALPNWRQRWCTRLLKIEPCLAFLKSLDNPILYVGLRADEEERRGIYSNDVTTDFPLRRWGWDIDQVLNYLRQRNIVIPEDARGGNCARCYGQRQYEWKALWRDHPDIYAEAEAQESMTGATFRSPGRDSLPAPLVELRAFFEHGKSFKQDQAEMFDEMGACRVCSL
jgi:3'-phosphoadenosine 5'-phosphosulfate sulfotransferase (PAPS reductase)/FAD synthetase